jgi:hypothetical protein
MPTRTIPVSGRGGSAMVNGIPLNITGWKGVLHIEFEESTASDSYVPATGKLWKIREEETVSLEGSLTGYYDTAGTTDSAFTQQLANAYGPYPISLNLTKSLLFAAGTCDFEQFTVNVMVPGAKTIDFSADFKFNANPTSMP